MDLFYFSTSYTNSELLNGDFFLLDRKPLAQSSVRRSASVASYFAFREGLTADDEK
jgi:hypothetical protein